MSDIGGSKNESALVYMETFKVNRSKATGGWTVVGRRSVDGCVDWGAFPLN